MNQIAVDLSIIIVTYNSSRVISRCLNSIRTSGSQFLIETIVIDNGSNDGTPELVSRDFPSAQLISGHGNIGFAAANNLGFRAARGRYFLVLNPDTETQAGALQELINYADDNETVGMIAPRLVNVDGTLQHSTFRFPDLTQALYGFFEKLVPIDSRQNGRYFPEDYNIERNVDHILGAAILVKRLLWTEIGGMDENYPLFFEETDWCYRAKTAGWHLRYIPTATIMHIGAHSTKNIPETSSVLFARSQARFYRKNLGLIHYIILKVIAVFGIAYWFSRSATALIRGNIRQNVFMTRILSYWQILTA